MKRTVVDTPETSKKLEAKSDFAERASAPKEPPPAMQGQPAQRLGVEVPARSSPAEAVAKDEFQPPGEGMAVKAKESPTQTAPLPKPAEAPAPTARPVPQVSKADAEAEAERRQDSQGARKELLDRDPVLALDQARDGSLKEVPPAKDAVPRKDAGRAQDKSISKVSDPAQAGPAQVYRVPAAYLGRVEQGLKDLMEVKGGKVEQQTLATGADPVGKPVHIVIKFPPERRAEVLLALAEFQRQLPAWLKESDTRMPQQPVKEGMEVDKESAKLSKKEEIKDSPQWDSLVIRIEPLSK